LRIDKPLFVFLEAVLNGVLFLVLPNVNLPMWAVAFLGVAVNAGVAYLMAETPNNTSRSSSSS